MNKYTATFSLRQNTGIVYIYKQKIGMDNNLEALYPYLCSFILPERVSKMDIMAAKSSSYVLPVLEDVYQYRNAAAVVRSAEGCGFHRVVAMESKNRFEPNLEVTKGAETWVRVDRMAHTLQSLEKLRTDGYRLVAVSPERDATPLPAYLPKQRTALIFGTEWQGVTEDFLHYCDETVSIPMYGFTQSFNVSVAAALCLYDLKQKLLQHKIEHYLTAEEQVQLKIQWAVRSLKSGPALLAKYLEEHGECNADAGIAPLIAADTPQPRAESRGEEYERKAGNGAQIKPYP